MQLYSSLKHNKDKRLYYFLPYYSTYLKSLNIEVKPSIDALYVDDTTTSKPRAYLMCEKKSYD